MSSTQYISDASTRHQVFLQRYGAGQSKEAVMALNRLRRDIMARLAQEPTQFQAQRLTAVLKDIEELSALAFKDMATNIKFGAMQLAANEAEFSAQLYNRATSASFSLPSEGALLAAVEVAPMTAPIGHKAITIDEALQAFGTKKAKQIVQTITDGVVLGDTTPVISRRLSETITTLQRRQLDTLVRTITNHTSSVAKMEVFNRNSDILDGYQFVATLDNRTTLNCAANDGKIFQIGMGPVSPLHWGCRSTEIPVVKDEYNLAKKAVGKRPSVGASGAEEVGGRTTYGGWLKKQPVEFIDEALGVERSRLFRSGKLTIDKFVDPTGRVYTLDQLKAMNPFVFAE